MSFYELFLITIILLPGILLMVFNEKDLYKDLSQEVPSFALRLVNHVILSFPFAILGLFFYKHGDFNLFSLNIDKISILLSLLVALINVAAYYYLKKNDLKEALLEGDKTRKKIWILTRCFYGGVVEEIIFRFGMISFFVWVGNLFIAQSTVSFWVANVLTSILFALAHLPGIYQKQKTVTKTMLLYINSINLLVGITCGWLYWQYGLLTAIMCHMLFHLVWYIFEKFEYQFNGKLEV
ncbi:CPBP family intramembrane glutamic endopeptidase [Lysinibacillus endophyticus]|uniref:CPBP family intramembrane metalloprotease n=1 Tax=Ureibacillus endophyticus TaxID=1978490 RepID=A0A494YYQ5_9BACL|nr:CPBP family intramembrane glutamic endopeptidase [Lysinibacillus endophyticus]MCP1146577.1 CPBP family intramembrane metalloprotease [Lysinibacillus endophyticus]RKQ15306.1 CPBP family intramembrane metalloprotease [Lysinibacillus endophyticus]